MTKSDYKWSIRFAIIVMLITIIPYVIGYYRQGDQWVFTGFLYAVEEGNSYIANMLTGATGNWLFRTPYTIYPQTGILAYFPYIVLGKLASPSALHEQLVAIFHIYRFIAGCLLIVATYFFMSHFFVDKYYRKMSTALIILGGGLGWLLMLFTRDNLWSSVPLEFYSPERFGFLEIFSLPHLAAARAFMLIGFSLFLSQNSWRKPVYSGISFFLSSLFQPLTALSALIIIIVYEILRFLLIIWRCQSYNRNEIFKEIRNRLPDIILMGVISSPILIYTGLISIINPFMIGWNNQSVVLSPPPIQYVWAYLLVLPLAIIGIAATRKNQSPDWLLPISWVIVFIVLSYFPHNNQRRVPEGVWVGWIILAVEGLRYLNSRKSKFSKIGKFSLYLVYFSTLVLFVGSFLSVWNLVEPQYQTKVEINAFNYFWEERINGLGRPTVLASYQTSNILPVWAPVKVAIGLSPLSIGIEQLNPRIQNFFSGKMDFNQQRDFLRELNVSYIYWGPAEKELGNWKPDPRLGLRTVYDQDNIQIFRVDNITNTQK